MALTSGRFFCPPGDVASLWRCRRALSPYLRDVFIPMINQAPRRVVASYLMKQEEVGSVHHENGPILGGS